MIQNNLYLISGLTLCGLFAYATYVGWDVVNFNPVVKNGGMFSNLYHK